MRFIVALAAAAAVLVAGHPGHSVSDELIKRQEFLKSSKRTDLNHCAAKVKAREIEARAVARRKAAAEKKAKRGFIPRDLSDINKSHLSDADFGVDTPLDTVFASNSSCVLSPEETEGPYYVSGEYIRSDIGEDQGGVDLIVDVAIYDVETCDPVTNVWVEIWHCNSTGVYSGVSSGGDFSSAPENLNNTFMRGAQLSDDDGAVQFTTLYPGHYSGRTTHIHIMVHPNATARANGTIYDTTASHVGQMYFDQDLNDLVETNSPYTTNTQAWTKNDGDSLLTNGLETSDPIMDYVLLGEDASDGILAWLSFGINTTYAVTAMDAATYYAGGGVQNNNGGGGGPGGAPPSGTGFPGGAPTGAPTGAPPS